MSAVHNCALLILVVLLELKCISAAGVDGSGSGYGYGDGDGDGDGDSPICGVGALGVGVLNYGVGAFGVGVLDFRDGGSGGELDFRDGGSGGELDFRDGGSGGELDFRDGGSGGELDFRDGGSGGGLGSGGRPSSVFGGGSFGGGLGSGGRPSSVFGGGSSGGGSSGGGLGSGGRPSSVFGGGSSGGCLGSVSLRRSSRDRGVRRSSRSPYVFGDKACDIRRSLADLVLKYGLDEVVDNAKFAKGEGYATIPRYKNLFSQYTTEVPSKVWVFLGVDHGTPFCFFFDHHKLTSCYPHVEYLPYNQAYTDYVDANGQRSALYFKDGPQVRAWRMVNKQFLKSSNDKFVCGVFMAMRRHRVDDLFRNPAPSSFKAHDTEMIACLGMHLDRSESHIEEARQRCAQIVHRGPMTDEVAHTMRDLTGHVSRL